MGTLLVGLAANLAMVGYLWLVYSELPAFFPIHYSAAGTADVVGPRQAVFGLPMAGGVILVVDLALASAIHAREPFAAGLLAAGSLAAQAALFVAVATTVRLALAG